MLSGKPEGSDLIQLVRKFLAEVNRLNPSFFNKLDAVCLLTGFPPNSVNEELEKAFKDNREVDAFHKKLRAIPLDATEEEVFEACEELAISTFEPVLATPVMQWLVTSENLKLILAGCLALKFLYVGTIDVSNRFLLLSNCFLSLPHKRERSAKKIEPDPNIEATKVIGQIFYDIQESIYSSASEQVAKTDELRIFLTKQLKIHLTIEGYTRFFKKIFAGLNGIHMIESADEAIRAAKSNTLIRAYNEILNYLCTHFEKSGKFQFYLMSYHYLSSIKYNGKEMVPLKALIDAFYSLCILGVSESSKYKLFRAAAGSKQHARFVETIRDMVKEANLSSLVDEDILKESIHEMNQIHAVEAAFLRFLSNQIVLANSTDVPAPPQPAAPKAASFDPPDYANRQGKVR